MNKTDRSIILFLALGTMLMLVLTQPQHVREPIPGSARYRFTLLKNGERTIVWKGSTDAWGLDFSGSAGKVFIAGSSEGLNIGGINKHPGTKADPLVMPVGGTINVGEDSVEVNAKDELAVLVEPLN